jgi:hypothetical protein
MMATLLSGNDAIQWEKEKQKVKGGEENSGQKGT